MRILALYPFLPYPAVSGAKQRGASVLDILASRHEVTLVSFFGRDDSPSDLTTWNTHERFAQPAVTVARQSDEELSPDGKRLRAMLPKPKFGMPEWLDFFDMPAMWNRLAELDLARFDAVHVRYISMALYALALKRMAPHLRLVIDLDDIPSSALARRFAYPKNRSQLRNSLWQLKELLKMYQFEHENLRRFDSVWICSQLDFEKMSRRIGRARPFVVENVVDAQKLASIKRQNTQPALLLVGDFSYEPNKEGAEFFVTKVWPEVRSKMPTAQLWLVGAKPDPNMLEWNGKEGIVVTGAVAEVSPYLAQAAVSIVPLLVGTGTRLKILEALGAGVPVVTTRIGVEGIEAKNEADLLIADTAEDFASACLRLLQDSALRQHLAESGKALVREKYNLPVMYGAVLNCYESIEATPPDIA